jgi:hypothetical protein
MKTSIELKIELQKLEQQRESLEVEEKELEQRLAVVRKLRFDLDGNRFCKGLIESKMAEIEKTESREKDEACPQPIWIESPTISFTTDKILVISRITKKG